MSEIEKIVKETILELHPEIDPETEEGLVEKKIIDSFDIVSIISCIAEKFDVAVPADQIIPENFNSVGAIAKLVEKLLDE